MSISFNNNDKPLLFCHRGYHKDAPENTLPAFELCLENNFKAIETDIHVCKSGELVILHDFNLKRMANIDKKVTDLCLDELKQLDFSLGCDKKYKGTPIATLREVFTLCSNNILYDLEIKSNKLNNKIIAKKTWELIKEFKLEYNCMISSFNPFAVKEFEKISKHGLRDGIIYSENEGVPKVLQHGFGAKLCSCKILKPDFIQLNSKKVKEAKDNNYDLLPWCVDSPEDAKKMINYEVMGIISNNPLELSKTGFFF